MTEIESAQEFETLLDYLKHSRGFDFSGYKRSSLMRRVKKRMQMIEMDSFTNYLDYLQVRPEEFEQLFNTILINVTAFFRDGEPWEYLSSEIVPRLLATRGKDEPIRVWIAGCSSGEEAYTVSILFAEAMGEAAYRTRVKVYATDADEEALNQARQALYDRKSVEGIPAELLARYFDESNGRYLFNRDLRRSVIFGRHDLVQDAPISRVDLLVCRNTLMYFNADAQMRILNNFHFALNADGYLFLGKSEMLLTHSNLFLPADLKRRIFTKTLKNGMRERLMMGLGAGDEPIGPIASPTRVRDAALDAGPVAQVVVDPHGALCVINQQARTLFGLAARDLGRPLQDVELSYRPIELRSRIEQAYAERHSIVLKDVPWSLSASELRYLDVQITPLLAVGGLVQGASITFADVSHYRQLQTELQNSKQELETAYEELQSTVEELETTNEELQSTNEELETMNEELQSTNEELETMNEELQSTNEELETINDELRQRTGDLNQVNGFLESILTGLRVGIVVLDRDLRIQIWNHRSEELWGIRQNEAEGQHFLNLDIGLPVDLLRQAIRACLSGEATLQEAVVEATNRRGRAIRCKVTCTPLLSSSVSPRGVILWMDDQEAASLVKPIRAIEQ